MSEEERRQFNQMKQEIAFLKRVITNLGGSLEFKTLVQQYTTGAIGGYNDINANNLNVKGTINHDGLRVGFFDVAPVAQASHIADPSGGGTVDSECRTAVNALLVVNENLGFTAKS